jgi:hypothetical protein
MKDKKKDNYYFQNVLWVFIILKKQYFNQITNINKKIDLNRNKDKKVSKIQEPYL